MVAPTSAWAPVPLAWPVLLSRWLWCQVRRVGDTSGVWGWFEQGYNPPMLLLLLPTGVALPVRIESSSPSVIEGQTLDLDCVVAGPSSAIVTWYKRGGSLPTGHQVGHNRVGSTPSAALTPAV